MKKSGEKKKEANPDTKKIISKGDLLAYLQPVLPDSSADQIDKRKRVVDRNDLQLFLPSLGK